MLSYAEKNEQGEWKSRSYRLGIADYCLLETGEIIVTNGKYVLAIKNNDDDTYSVKRLVNTNCCLKVMPIKKYSKQSDEDIFNGL